MDCKSQWQRHAKESRRTKASTGDSRGKNNSRAPFGRQITMAGTQKGEAATEGVNQRQPRLEQQQSPLWTANHNEQGHTKESQRPKASTGDSHGKQQQSPLWTANHNGRDTERRAGDRRRQPATAAARTTAEPLMDCKSQWQGHRKETRRPQASIGDSHRNSRDTRRRASDRRRQPATAAASAKASTGDSRGKNNSRAPFGRQITMAGTQKGEAATEGVNRRQARLEQQQSPLWTANHNGQGHTKETRRPKRPYLPVRSSISKRQQLKLHCLLSGLATAAARTTAEPLMDCKSQWQRHAKESRRPKASTGDSRGKRYRRASLWIANYNSRDTQRSCDPLLPASATLPSCRSWISKSQQFGAPLSFIWIGDSRGKNNSRAAFGRQITMAGTQKREPAREGVNRRQPRQEQQQSPFWTANHNGRDTERRGGDRRCQPATGAARTTAEPLMDCKSQ